MMWHDLDFWRTATIASAAIGQTGFALLYATFPWWRSFIGRALFFKAVTFALLVDVAIVARVADWAHEDAYIVALYGLVAVGIWGQFVAFLRIRARGRQQRVDNRGEESLST